MELTAQKLVDGDLPPIEEAVERASSNIKERLTPYCGRSQFTASFLRAVVLQYAREHPDLLDEPAADQMLEIMKRALPCDDER